MSGLTLCRRRNASFRVWGRPDEPIQPLIEMSYRAAPMSIDADKQRIGGEAAAFVNAYGRVGSERFFACKQSDESVVRLADKNGKRLLVIRVGVDGIPSTEFLDGAGKVIKRIAP